MCNCSGGNCKCAPFKKSASEVFTRGASYNNSEKAKNSATSGRVPVGKRGSKSVGKR